MIPPKAVTVRLHSLAAAASDATGDTFESLLDVAYTDADGNAQTESLPDVEHLTGSNHDDIQAGDRHDNVIDGGTGNDDSGKYFRFIPKLSTFHTVWFVCDVSWHPKLSSNWRPKLSSLL